MLVERRGLTLFACLLGVAIFGLSCWLPATGTCQIDGTVHETGSPGIMLLISGWVVPLFGVFGWFANPLFLNSLIRLTGNKFPRPILSALGIGFGVSSFLYARSFNYMDDADDHLHVCHPRIGYYLWMLAFVMMFGMSMLKFPRVRKVLGIELID